ncbi:flavin reductase [Ekhidna sp.]|uniref:flavin reductase n=1 Tax=Ekhidna sp. TaxID=2608089 RepID=UPI003CCBECB7
MGVKRPWNMVDMPVYSLATYDGDKVNMNICTYVTAISMKPKMFMVAIDYVTKTFENLEKDSNVILQILHQNHQSLVRLLGKKSGKNVNKHEKLTEKGLIGKWNGHQVLIDACGYLSLQLKGRQDVGGDHELFWFEVQKSKTNSEDNILMFQDLIRAGIIL